VTFFQLWIFYSVLNDLNTFSILSKRNYKMALKNNNTVIAETLSKDGKSKIKIYLNELTNTFYLQDDNGNVSEMGAGGAGIQRMKFELNASNFDDLVNANDTYGIILLNEEDYAGKWIEIIGQPYFTSNGEPILTSGEVVMNHLLIYHGWGPTEYKIEGNITELNPDIAIEFAGRINENRIPPLAYYKGMTEEESPNVFYAASVFLYANLGGEYVINPAWKGFVEFDYCIRG
jgi:hypothetical protein